LKSIPELLKSLKIPSRFIFPCGAEFQKDEKLAHAGRRRKHVCIFILTLHIKHVQIWRRVSLFLTCKAVHTVCIVDVYRCIDCMCHVSYWQGGFTLIVRQLRGIERPMQRQLHCVISYAGQNELLILGLQVPSARINRKK
jgi:hypothetical protein